MNSGALVGQTTEGGMYMLYIDYIESLYRSMYHGVLEQVRWIKPYVLGERKGEYLIIHQLLPSDKCQMYVCTYIQYIDDRFVLRLSGARVTHVVVSPPIFVGIFDWDGWQRVNTTSTFWLFGDVLCHRTKYKYLYRRNRRRPLLFGCKFFLVRHIFKYTTEWKVAVTRYRKGATNSFSWLHHYSACSYTNCISSVDRRQIHCSTKKTHSTPWSSQRSRLPHSLWDLPLHSREYYAITSFAFAFASFHQERPSEREREFGSWFVDRCCCFLWVLRG
jgi:hypothetical protein